MRPPWKGKKPRFPTPASFQNWTFCTPQEATFCCYHLYANGIQEEPLELSLRKYLYLQNHPIHIYFYLLFNSDKSILVFNFSLSLVKFKLYITENEQAYWHKIVQINLISITINFFSNMTSGFFSFLSIFVQVLYLVVCSKNFVFVHP